jgi:hypothetical protein
MSCGNLISGQFAVAGPDRAIVLNAHSMDRIANLAAERMLGGLLDRLRASCGAYDLIGHHQQGEFHHDIFMRVTSPRSGLPGEYLVVSTNCNGGVKEVLCFAEPVEASALWHFRCPDNPDFSGELPAILALARTEHWFEPCELLSVDARSELRAEYRQRQNGGGWCKRT